MTEFSCTNTYECCGTQWEVDHCDSFCNDECNACSSEVTPLASLAYAMHIYEVTLQGFDGGTDETDHLVLWVLCGKDKAKELNSNTKVIEVLLLGDIPHLDADYVEGYDDSRLSLDINLLANTKRTAGY